jgi:hypothetical protein
MAQSERKANSTEMHALFDKLKAAFVTAPVLAFPDFKLPFVIQCDASNVALGAVIGQMTSNRFRPVMYGSRHLTAAETRYSATERDLLVIVWAAKRFNPYIYGRHATFVTDHQPMVTMRSLKEPMRRIGRLLHKIQDFDYELVYQPGASNCTADFLSRPSVDANTVELRIESCINWSLEQSVDFAVCSLKSVVVAAEQPSEATIPDEVPHKSDWSRLLDKLDVD